MREMFVTIEWDKRELAVPLAQLQALKVDKETQQAMEDWHYWVGIELLCNNCANREILPGRGREARR